ncbi:hypothetical protein H0A36_21760 [Endozoicomonas sp. SM1973]|uniref:Uncharacterized protein n=1 Tax=Spartinivicinus marinus TaxID=2994442 RepID=A0A853IGP6_9GAMM|nr:hypothetical protein [Spartinivicinus marinus]MCX4025831.1 hypothetical protein [Spartinivicinus marinus]NYZ68647.1 hypothetical protein [Spartinivicinus marinus]
MSVFGKLKSAINMVTGGAAEVSAEYEEPKISEPFNVIIRATTKSEQVKIDKVYLKIRGIEEVEVNVTYTETDHIGETRSVTDCEHRSHITYEDEYIVSEKQILAADTEHEWVQAVSFPEGCRPCYCGHNAIHRYEIFAGLDCFGNDPDSGWIQLPYFC